MKLTVKHIQMVGLYSIAHFLVDFACAFLMFRSIAGTREWYSCVLLYNFCAFAMQMPLGILADRLNRNYLFAVFGCALVGAAYGICRYPVAAVCAVGIGNALFHLGGGIDVLNISEAKSGALGVFVSPGAFGIYFGTMLGKGEASVEIPILAALFAAAALVVALAASARRARRFRNAHGADAAREDVDAQDSRFASLHEPEPERDKATYKTPAGVHAIGSGITANSEFSVDASPSALVAVACFFLVVCLRSYVGLAVQFPLWKGVGYWGFALVCAVVFGKVAGGFVADRFGARGATCASLGLAAIFFLFPQFPATGLLSILLFNMTMPTTLWALAKVYPGARGFAFGLLTFGLFLGFLPVYFGVSAPPGASWVFALGAVVSLALLMVGLRKVKM